MSSWQQNLSQRTLGRIQDLPPGERKIVCEQLRKDYEVMFKPIMDGLEDWEKDAKLLLAFIVFGMAALVAWTLYIWPF